MSNCNLGSSTLKPWQKGLMIKSSIYTCLTLNFRMLGWFTSFCQWPMWNSESESLSIGLIYWVTLKLRAYWVMFSDYNEHPSARTWDCSFPDPYIIGIRLQIIKLWISKLKCQIYLRSSFISFNFKPILSSIMSASIFSKTANAVNSGLDLPFLEIENRD